MSTTPTVLTVCLGNICRSPTAAAAIEEAASAAGVPVSVASAGTGRWHVGKPPDRRMRAAAAEDGLTLTGRAEQIDARMLAEADLVLVMDRSNLTDVQRVAEDAGIDVPIRLFREFDPGRDPESPSDLEVPDPYYGGREGFAEVVAICRRTAAEVVAHLAAEHDRGTAAG